MWFWLWSVTCVCVCVSTGVGTGGQSGPRPHQNYYYGKHLTSMVSATTNFRAGHGPPQRKSSSYALCVCVCVCVRVHAYMHGACACACMYARACVHVCVCVHMCMHGVRVRVCACVCVRACVWPEFLQKLKIANGILFVPEHWWCIPLLLDLTVKPPNKGFFGCEHNIIFMEGFKVCAPMTGISETMGTELLSVLI